MSEICCKGTGETGTRCEYDDAWFCKNPDCKSPVLTSTMLGAHPSGCPKIYDWTEGQVNRMSEDLISRRTIKSLIETIRDCWAISPYVSANDMKLYSKVFNVVLNEISNCPTAFDKEKVVEELMKCSDHPCTLHECGVRSEYCSACMAKKAIEIVEKGGIE